MRGAVGITPKYVVAVWCGNADGEGRAGLTGVSAAAPVMFDVFSTLPDASWVRGAGLTKWTALKFAAKAVFCLAKIAKKEKTILVPHGNKVGVCRWHQRIHLNAEQTHRVNANCYPVSKMVHKNWFVLPPSMEYYNKRENVLYATLPPLMPGCTENQQQLDFIYPREWNRIFIPVELDGTKGKLIVELAHRLNNVDVYWYLDDDFLGVTKNMHQFELRPEPGWHTITVSDNLGNLLTKRFLVVNR